MKNYTILAELRGKREYFWAFVLGPGSLAEFVCPAWPGVMLSLRSKKQLGVWEQGLPSSCCFDPHQYATQTLSASIRESMLRTASQAGGCSHRGARRASTRPRQSKPAGSRLCIQEKEVREGPLSKPTPKRLRGPSGALTACNPFFFTMRSHQDLFVKLYKHTEQWFTIKVS